MPEELDPIWKALADPTRRRILDLLRTGPRDTGALVREFPELTRFGVMKHLDVLREAGLVNVRKEGRRRMNSINAVPLHQIYRRWVSRFEDLWARNLTDIQAAAEEDRPEPEH